MESLHLNDITFHGQDLFRPECVLATEQGSLYTSDWNGGITWLRPDQGQQRILAKEPSIDFKPNGFALCEDGSFLIANISDDGGVWRLGRDGQLSPFLLEVDGQAVPASNFVLLDHDDRIWITISTRREPRSLGYRADVDDGYIILVDEKGARIVADGLGFTNEVVVSADGRFLYVNETFTRKTSRFPILGDNTLGPKQVVVEYGPGTFPDGLTVDQDGGLWITSIISNRVIYVDKNGQPTIVLEDSDAEHLAWVEADYNKGALGRPHLDTIKSKMLKNVSSLCFAGPQLTEFWLGCLLGDQVMRLSAPVPGRPPAHWRFPW